MTDDSKTGTRTRAFRASVLHFLTDPGSQTEPAALEYFDDGLLVVGNGRVKDVGPASQLLAELPRGIEVTDYSGKLIMPGFIDTHVHYSQTDVIAAYGEQLLDWLSRYAFPAERRFSEPAHAREVAEFFLDELLRNGVTSAMVFGTVHTASVDAIMSAAQARRMCLLAGKVMMDRNCPDDLQDTAESGYRDSAGLIDKWHGTDRLGYAVTLRFAPTSSEEQLEQAGALLEQYPGVHFQTHVAENQNEIAWVAELFPWSRSYLDVYDRFGLLRERSVFAHCIYLDEEDRGRMAASGAAIAFCPTSNLFLGSGLFDVDIAHRQGIRIGIGTDVGGGTSFSMLRTLSEAYKIAQLTGHSLSVQRAFYLATLGAAESLYLDDRLGNFAEGKMADFVVLNFDATPLIERRLGETRELAEKLFVLMMLGDDRSISATYVGGRAAHFRS